MGLIPDLLNIDVEITTHCNARCSFCPREDVPFLQHMSQETYRKVLARLKEVPRPVRITFCGTGDASTHPQFVSFVEQAKAEGFHVTLTSNGQRIYGERIDRLLKAGLDEMNFSIAELEADYDRVYDQPFERIRKNVLEFKEKLAGHKTRLVISFITETRIKNDPKVKRNKQYWSALGFTDFKVMKFTNRAGSGDIDLSEKYFREFLKEAPSRGIDIVYCPTPYFSFFIGPDGFYYLCCHDFSKRKTFGHVDTDTLADSYRLKEEYFRSDNSICINCSAHPAHHHRIYPNEFPDFYGQLKAFYTEVGGLVESLTPRSMHEQRGPSGIPFRELPDAPDDPAPVRPDGTSAAHD